MMRVEDLQDVDARIDRLTFGVGQAATKARAKAHPPGIERILLAVDGSPASDDALAWAADLAGTFDAQLQVVTVIPPPSTFTAYMGGGPAIELYGAEEAGARRVLEEAQLRLREQGITADTVLAAGSPVDQVAWTAKAARADLIVVGSHGRGPVGRLLLGSVADGVKNHARANVLIAKGPVRKRHVLIATDGSLPSRRAAALGLRIAAKWGAHATILHAVAPPMHGPLEPGKRAFDHAFQQLDVPSWQGKEVSYDLQFGWPAERILAAAKDLHAGIVVMGCRGLGGLKAWTAGSVSSRVAHEAPCSVLLAKEPPTEEAEVTTE